MYVLCMYVCMYVCVCSIFTKSCFIRFSLSKYMLSRIIFRLPFIIYTSVSASDSCISMASIWLFVATTAALHLPSLEVKFLYFF